MLLYYLHYYEVFFLFQIVFLLKVTTPLEDMTTLDSNRNEMFSKPSKSNFGVVSSASYDPSPEYLQKWIEGYALLIVIIVGATANLFSLIIIRNKELNLIRDFSRLLQSQVCNNLVTFTFIYKHFIVKHKIFHGLMTLTLN